MPWVTPCAVAVTIEQCRAWAGCGARLKAAIAPTATAATTNLLMALSFLQVTVRVTAYTLRLTRFIAQSSLGSLVKGYLLRIERSGAFKEPKKLEEKK